MGQRLIQFTLREMNKDSSNSKTQRPCTIERFKIHTTMAQDNQRNNINYLVVVFPLFPYAGLCFEYCKLAVPFLMYYGSSHQKNTSRIFYFAWPLLGVGAIYLQHSKQRKFHFMDFPWLSAAVINSNILFVCYVCERAVPRPDVFQSSIVCCDFGSIFL